MHVGHWSCATSISASLLLKLISKTVYLKCPSTGDLNSRTEANFSQTKPYAA